MDIVQVELNVNRTNGQFGPGNSKIYSRLSRHSTARGSNTRLFLVGPTNSMNAMNLINQNLINEKSIKIQEGSIFAHYTLLIRFFY